MISSDRDMRARIIDWAKKHKNPEQQIELGELILTPRSILRHLNERTEVGDLLIARWRSMLSHKGKQ